jgi:hypothetical protein
VTRFRSPFHTAKAGGLFPSRALLSRQLGSPVHLPETWPGTPTRALSFGHASRTVFHIPLIRAVALAVALVRSPQAVRWLFQDHPMRPGPVPDGYAWSLGLLYAVAALAIGMLYLPCRWLADRKAQRRHAWLSYL